MKDSQVTKHYIICVKHVNLKITTCIHKEHKEVGGKSTHSIVYIDYIREMELEWSKNNKEMG